MVPSGLRAELGCRNLGIVQLFTMQNDGYH